MIIPQDGVVIAGRYTLTRPLARGGMGSVWVARHRDLEIDVSVKFMDPSLVAASEARARFEHEARSAARLDSQHVVQVLDYGIENDTPYMVMELLKGETLAVRLSREGRLPLPAAARLVIQVCKALRTAHEAGLVHRDLKPGNVFLAIKDEDEVAKVLDFGIAKTTILGHAGTGTESGVLLGSAHYMSPEQVRNSSGVDHRSDLWSLGVILYRALVGRLPFPGKDFGDVMVRVCTDPFPAPSSIAPDLPARVDGFFFRALAREPERRFQSARELAEAFCSIAMEAPPVSSSEPSEKRTMRMDLMSVPPPPPSSDAAGAAMVETAAGTLVMAAAGPTTARLSLFGPTQRSATPDPAAQPVPSSPDDDAATLAMAPESMARRLPTPNAAPPAAPVFDLPDDPPVVPVSSFWPAWVAAGALVVSALVGVAFWGRTSTSVEAAAPAPPTATVAASPGAASPGAATTAAATTAVATTATSAAIVPADVTSPPAVSAAACAWSTRVLRR